MFAAHQGVVCETPHLRLAVSSNHVVKRTYSLFQRTRAKVTSWLSEAAGHGSNSRSVLQPHQQHQGKATVPILVEATAPARNASTMADVAVQAQTGRVGRFTRWSPVGLAGGLASVGHVRPLFSSAAMLRTSFAPVQVQIRSMGIFSSSTTEIDRLYDRADDEPDNPVAQAKLLHVLAEEEPEEAIRRFESGQFASNDDCVKAYITALVNTGGLRRANLSKLVAKHVPSAAAPAAAASAHAAPADGPQPISNLSRPVQHAYGGGSGSYRRGSDFGDGSEQEPIVVALQEPSFKAQMWRLIRTIVFVIIFISVINGVFEDRGLGGKSPLTQNEIHPETLKKPTTFEDVQGADEAKDELMDVVEFLRNPDKFTRLGGRLPKGVLLVGPPGTGKTLLARAVAGEAGVPFFYSSGSEFDEMFVGVGARRVRDLFAAAKKKSPCIIFLDEIDAVGGRRSRRDQQFVRMTLNQLLVEMDGFDQNEAVIVIAATNFPEMLDPALTRPGRFDTHIRVPLPDIQGRKKILQTHAKKIPLANEDDLLTIARGTVGFSGAELANLINQAALQASRLHRDVVDLEMLEWAKDKILMGSERKSAVITEKDRRITAFHEAGHALCAIYSEGAHPLYKATIVPRGQALGMVTQLPEDDTNSMSRKQLTARLVVAMGGRAAEEKIFGSDEITTGASSDVEQATRLAHAMVTKYAMSDKVGPVLYRDEDPISDETKLVVEGEVKQLLEGAYKSAKDILSKHEREHHRLAEALLDYETLTADEIRTVIAGKSLSRSKPTLKK